MICPEPIPQQTTRESSFSPDSCIRKFTFLSNVRHSRSVVPCQTDWSATNSRFRYSRLILPRETGCPTYQQLKVTAEKYSTHMHTRHIALPMHA